MLGWDVVQKGEDAGRGWYMTEKRENAGMGWVMQKGENAMMGWNMIKKKCEKTGTQQKEGECRDGRVEEKENAGLKERKKIDGTWKQHKRMLGNISRTISFKVSNYEPTTTKLL